MGKLQDRVAIITGASDGVDANVICPGAPTASAKASDDCRWTTGNTLFVGGGTHINGSAWAPELPDDA